MALMKQVSVVALSAKWIICSLPTVTSQRALIINVMPFGLSLSLLNVLITNYRN